MERRVGFGMSNVIENNVLYVLKGESRDVETIIRTRPWMEDEVRSTYGEFSKSQLYTDYKPSTETFEFKIVFFK